MPKSTCTVCKKLVEAGNSRCESHKPVRQKTSSTSRGYGAGHQRVRARWVPHVNAGNVRCARCGLLIVPGTKWHLGHKDGTFKMEYSGPEHEFCNTQAGGRNKGRGDRRGNWNAER